MLGYKLLQGLFEQEAEHRKMSGRTYNRPTRISRSWSHIWYRLPDEVAGGLIFACILLLAGAFVWAFFSFTAFYFTADATYSKKVVPPTPVKAEAAVVNRNYVYHYTLTEKEYEDLEYRRQLHMIDQQTTERMKNNHKDDSK